MTTLMPVTSENGVSQSHQPPAFAVFSVRQRTDLAAKSRQASLCYRYAMGVSVQGLDRIPEFFMIPSSSSC